MADSLILLAEKREGHGTHAARRLRSQGRVPAVIYGHKEATLSLSLPAEELVKAIRHGTRVVDLQTDGAKQKALIREVQWDHLGKELLHVDFARVAEDERIHVTVPLELRGTAPGVTQGGMLDQPIHALPIECLAVNIPESIRVNIGELGLGAALHVRDLVLPEGVKTSLDPEAIVVHVQAPQEEPQPGAAAAEQAEPEVIGRQRTEEEGGE